MDLEILEKLKNLHYAVIAAIITAVVSLFVAILNYINQRKALKIQQATLKLQEATNQNVISTQKVNSLEKQLQEFYKPFNGYLSQSAFLYQNFRAGLPSDFRTLIYLTDKEYEFADAKGGKSKVVLSEKSLKLLSKILEIEEKLTELISTKGGIVEDERLVLNYSPSKNITDILINFDPNRPENLPERIGLLSLFLVHCSLLKLAHQGELEKANIESIKKFVYPRELNKIIEENIIKISSDISNLKATIK